MPARREKGMLVRLGADGSEAARFVFPCNPEMLRRCVELVPGVGDAPARPAELVFIQIRLDAVDALAAGNARAARVGLHPELAALDLLAYGERGTSAGAGLAVFHWGANRVVPVRVRKLDVVEEAFDAALNPIRATVWVDLEVIDTALGAAGRRVASLFRAYIDRKTALARGVDSR